MSKPITEAQLVTLRSIEGGHVRINLDGTFALPDSQRSTTARALIKAGLADTDSYDRKVVLTDAGRKYLAGRDAS